MSATIHFIGAGTESTSERWLAFVAEQELIHDMTCGFCLVPEDGVDFRDENM